MAYADVWDLTTPTPTEITKNGDDRIRELKRALDQRLATVLDGWPNTDPLNIKADLVRGKAFSTDQNALKFIGGAVNTEFWNAANNTINASLNNAGRGYFRDGVQLGSGGATLVKAFTADVSWDIPNVVAGGSSISGVVSIPGVLNSDLVVVEQTSIPYAYLIKGTANTDQVELTFFNLSGSAIDWPSDSFRVLVLRVA